MVKEFTVGTAHTINLGNYESLRVEASITITGEDTEEALDLAQIKLRKLLEDTYRAQRSRPSGGNGKR
jgi:hypothetical protein